MELTVMRGEYERDEKRKREKEEEKDVHFKSINIVEDHL